MANVLTLRIDYHDLRVLAIYALNWACSVEGDNRPYRARIQEICSALDAQISALDPLLAGTLGVNLRAEGRHP